MHQNRAKRDDANPDLCKKLPPERSRYKYFSFSFHFCHPCKDLLPLHMMLDFRLCIPDYVITVCMNAADPMHDKLSARPLVKYDITFPKFPLRCSEENTVASMNQKRRHAAPGNHHTHFSVLLYKFFQHSDIGTCIHHFHACFSLF